jgi:hypothetical protein
MGYVARLFDSALQTQGICTYRTLSKNHRVEKHRLKPKAGEHMQSPVILLFYTLQGG